MPTAEDLGLATGAVATNQGATAQVPDTEKKDETNGEAANAQKSADAGEATKESAADQKSGALDQSDTDGVAGSGPNGLDTSDGYTGPKDIIPDEPPHVPAHNSSGHRNVVCDNVGNVTVLDDDTAEMLYENPKFYENIFHNGNSYPVSRLIWANAAGSSVTVEPVGEDYELGK